MWTKAFWKATGERVVRGAAVAMFAGFFGGDVTFDAMNVNTWQDFGALGVSGAVGSLLLCLIGGATSGDNPASPALTGTETVDPAVRR